MCSHNNVKSVAIQFDFDGADYNLRIRENCPSSNNPPIVADVPLVNRLKNDSDLSRSSTEGFVSELKDHFNNLRHSPKKIRESNASKSFLGTKQCVHSPGPRLECTSNQVSQSKVSQGAPVVTCRRRKGTNNTTKFSIAGKNIPVPAPSLIGSMSHAELSLIAAFDDMRRLHCALRDNSDTDFLSFVTGVEEFRKQTSRTLEASKEYELQLKHSEKQRGLLDQKLRFAQNAVDMEATRRIKAEKERDNLQKQFNLIREILLNGNDLTADQRSKLAFLNNNAFATDNRPAKTYDTINTSESLISDKEFSYDKTDDFETSHLRNGKSWKRSGTGMEHHQKSMSRKKRSLSAPNRDVLVDKPIADNIAYADVHEPKLDLHLDLAAPRAIPSAPCLTPITEGCSPLKVQAEQPRGYNVRLPPPSPGSKMVPKTPEKPVKRHLFDSPSASCLNRQHEFVPKMILKNEKCAVCNKRLNFGKNAVRCKGCSSLSHYECQGTMRLPCVPTGPTTPKDKQFGGTLEDYVTLDGPGPYVPGLVVHCVNEIEMRGFSEEGLYRKSGNKLRVQELKEKFFRGRGRPNMTDYDDHEITCCLKSFLRELKYPLIPYSFVEATMHTEDRGQIETILYQNIGLLSESHRDTLAFLILHLQRVAVSTNTRMDYNDLAVVFGPSIVGNSRPDLGAVQEYEETKHKTKIVLRLLEFPAGYWQSFLDLAEGGFTNSKRPAGVENMPPPMVDGSPGMGANTMLGPIPTLRSGGRAKTRMRTRTAGTDGAKRRYFNNEYL